jgi:DNA-binding HxlR family transcriptional regulator
MRIEKKPGCIKATARILGDKWSPLLVRALTISPLRFCELQKAASMADWGEKYGSATVPRQTAGNPRGEPTFA